MSNLENQSPAETYKGLLQVNDYTDGVDATAKYIQDGEGTNSALAISTDRVGIGTTNPDAPLHISHPTGDSLILEKSTTEPSVRFKGDADTDFVLTVSQDRFKISPNDGVTSLLEVAQNGNVGIGTTSPSSKLEITDSINHLNLKVPDKISQSVVKFSDKDGIGATINYDHNADKLHFITDGTAIPTNGALNIDSAGKVGIGTTSPESELHVAGDIILSGLTTSNQGTRAKIVHTSGTEANGDDASNDGGLIFQSNNNGIFVDGLTIDHGGKVGIGTASPDLQLDVNGGIQLRGDQFWYKGGAFRFINRTTGSSVETMRIDSSGNVGIGMPNPARLLHLKSSNSAIAFETPISADGSGFAQIKSSRDGTSGYSSTLEFATTESTAPVEKFGDNGSGGSGFVTRMVINSGGHVLPGTDNTQPLGSASKRWDVIYVKDTNITTSDRQQKQDIEELSEAETRVAQACKGLLRKYRWKDQVATKGDEARIHFGIIAQDLEAAFAAEGLDAGRYGMFVKNTWWTADIVTPAVEAVEAVEAVYDEEGNEVSPAVEAVEAQPERTSTKTFDNVEDAPEGATEVTQRGVRYSELLAFIIAAI